MVKEGERGITPRFGKVLRDDENKPLVYAPGLHFKIPFIESVKMLDARIQTMEQPCRSFCDQKKKDLIVDSTSNGVSATFSQLLSGDRWRRDISQAEVPQPKRKFRPFAF